jgi:16S rRNA (cytidine1402-2'-O)-methyltransferase
MNGTLYLVGTPIGNLEDITDRARRTLAEVDLVAAEDTRRTGRLLRRLGVKKPLVSLFDANERERVPELVARLKDGADLAVVSDAGMPGLSDPGYRLVASCLEAGIQVDVVPGPSAVLTALVVSGLPTDRFAFEGFLPRAGTHRTRRLQSLASETRTIVLFESPKRVERTLADLLATVGDRRVAVARELTKLHQELIRGRITEVLAGLAGRVLRGEVVLVVEGTPDRGRREPPEDAVGIAAALVSGGARKREAARAASRRTGVPAGRIYQALVEAGRARTSSHEAATQGAAAGSRRRAAGRRAASSE